MSTYVVPEDYLTDIADAIRSKTGSSDGMEVNEMPGQIRSITTGDGSGENGATFIPTVDNEGNLSWSNDKGLENPTPVNIKGPQGDPGLVWCGEWNDNGEYRNNEVVYHNGSSFIAVTDGGAIPSGIEPGTDDTSWQMLASKGSDGAAGADGKTPVKGTDYFTPTDKAEMVAAVIAALPVYTGEVV